MFMFQQMNSFGTSRQALMLHRMNSAPSGYMQAPQSGAGGILMSAHPPGQFDPQMSAAGASRMMRSNSEWGPKMSDPHRTNGAAMMQWGGTYDQGAGPM